MAAQAKFAGAPVQIKVVVGSGCLSFKVQHDYKLMLYFSAKIEGEGEPSTEPHPPVAFLAVVGQEFSWEKPRVGMVPYQALPLLQFVVHNICAGKV